DPQHPDRRVGELRVGLVAGDGEDARIALAEGAGEGYDGEDREGGDDRQERCEREDEAPRPARDQVLLEDQLQAGGQGLEHAEGPGPVRADAVLHVGDHLALEPHHEDHRDQQDEERDEHLAEGDQHLREADPVAVQRVQRVDRPDHRTASTRTSVTTADASTSSAASAPGWRKASSAAPLGTVVDGRTGRVTEPRPPSRLETVTWPSTSIPRRSKSWGCRWSTAPGA